MANIKLQDLTSLDGSDLFNDPESFIRDISKCELSLQGGKKHRQPVPNSIPTPTPVDPGFDFPFPPAYYPSVVV